MRTLHSLDRAFVALAHDHHQIDVAIFGRGAPRMRAEEINRIRLELRLQAFNDGFQQARGNRSHKRDFTQPSLDCNAGALRGIEPERICVNLIDRRAT